MTAACQSKPASELQSLSGSLDPEFWEDVASMGWSTPEAVLEQWRREKADETGPLHYLLCKYQTELLDFIQALYEIRC